MKPLRLLLLLLSPAFAFLAAYLFERLSLAGFFPAALLRRLPALTIYAYWLPADLLTAALGAAVLAMLLFGLAAPAWTGLIHRRVAPARGEPRRARRGAALLLLLTAGLALLPAAGSRLLGLGGWTVAALWAGGLLLVAATAGTLGRARTARLLPDADVQPERSWPLLLLILAAAALLFGRQAGALPAAPPATSFAVALQGQTETLQGGPFAPGSAGLPAPAILGTALAQRVAQNPLRGLAAGGVGAGLALVAVTWLLGTELFRRQPQRWGAVAGSEGDVAEDDGRTPALLAALALAVALPMTHAARLPWLLEAGVWGVLGLWLLLRAARTGAPGAAAGSGVCLGMAALWSPGGWLFAAVAAVAWGGLLLWRAPWFETLHGGLGLRGGALWAVALAVTAAPALCLWACGAATPAATGPAPAGAWSEGLRAVLTVLGLSIDALPTPAHAPTVGLLHATLLLLALGGLLFSLDQPLGWLLLGWLGVGVALAARRAAPGGIGWHDDWHALVLLFPAVALAVAFALDRMRATLAATLGGWTAFSANVLAAGLLVVAGFAGWQAYPRATGVFDAALGESSALARAAAALPSDAALFLLAESAGPAAEWDDPALRLVQNARTGSASTLATDDPTAWAALPPGAYVLAPPRLRAPVDALAGRVPGLALHTERDLLGNPAAYVVGPLPAPD